MMTRRTALLAGAAAAAALAAPAAPAAAAPPAYRVVDLGTLPGDTVSQAAAVNGHGLVVGSSGDRAVVWRHGRIAALPVGSGYAVDVNDRGDVVGTRHDAGPGGRAFLWRDGRLRTLGPLPGDGTSLATAVGERGDVLGVSVGDTVRSVLWRPDGTVVDLTARTGLIRIADLDDSGRYVGEKLVDGMNTVPAMWHRGRLTVLSERGGAAAAVNERGVVAGGFGVGRPEAFTWSRGRLTVVPWLPGTDEMLGMRATGINDRGLVVGVAGFDGFAWDGGRPTVLPGLVRGTFPADVSDRGAIVGSSPTTADGLDPHAVLLLPRR